MSPEICTQLSGTCSQNFLVPVCSVMMCYDQDLRNGIIPDHADREDRESGSTFFPVGSTQAQSSDFSPPLPLAWQRERRERERNREKKRRRGEKGSGPYRDERLLCWVAQLNVALRQAQVLLSVPPADLPRTLSGQALELHEVRAVPHAPEEKRLWRVLQVTPVQRQSRGEVVRAACVEVLVPTEVWWVLFDGWFGIHTCGPLVVRLKDGRAGPEGPAEAHPGCPSRRRPAPQLKGCSKARRRRDDSARRLS
jgi:hypothetical protein